MKKLFLTLLLLACLADAFGQSLAHQREARLGKGVNLSNWLEAYWLGANWGQAGRYQKQDLQDIAAAGMKTVRLPFCFALITDSQPPYQVDFGSPAVAWLDSVIAWCDDLQLNLIIDNQHGWDLSNGNYLDKIAPMTAMWRQVVTRYSSLDPERYFFEMLNEPPLGLLPSYADAVNLACIDTIRRYDQDHTLIVGPHSASIGSSYLTFSPYPDTNLIYTFHTYEPLYFTHQGFSWFPVPFPTGTPFPLLGDDALVRTSLQTVADWRDTHQRPVFMGEFGVGINADAASRCNWAQVMGELIDEHGFNWCYWDWGGVAPSDFSMFDQLPPGASAVIPCFAEALHLYNFTDRAEEDLLGALRIYPNPADGYLFLDAGIDSPPVTGVELYDLQMRLILKEDGRGGTRIRLDVSGLPSGMYVVQARDRAGKSVRRPVMVR